MKKRLNLLVFLISFIFLIVIVGIAQTRNEFKQKYGSPNSKGQYVVKPDIGLLVKYDQSRNPSEMIIESLDTNTANGSSSERKSSNKVMPSDEAEEVLNELVPVAKRGKKIEQSHYSFGCASLYHTDYEQVTINIAKRCEAQGGGTYSITVRWKQE